jgi:hypothetical protein
VVRKSHRIRTPRSEAPQAAAISGAVEAPSPILVNRSMSIADFSAADRWKARMVSK